MVKVSKILYFCQAFFAPFCHFRAPKPAGPEAVALSVSWVIRQSINSFMRHHYNEIFFHRIRHSQITTRLIYTIYTRLSNMKYQTTGLDDESSKRDTDLSVRDELRIDTGRIMDCIVAELRRRSIDSFSKHIRQK